MARRSGFERALIAASRDISRQVRIAEQARKRMLREQATAARQANAQAARDFRLRNLSAKEAERERKAAYLEAREEQVRQLNADLERKLDEYATLLQHTLHVNDAIEFDTLRITDKFVPPKIPPELLTKIEPPDFKTYFSHLKAPGKLASALMPWVKRRFERAVAEATERAKADLQKIKASEADRQGQLQTLRDRLAKQQEDFSTKVAMRDAEVDAFQNDYMAGEPDALVAYFSMVLERSEYPDEFPQNELLPVRWTRS